MEYIGEGCECRVCGQKHFCPDRCGMHYNIQCICTECYLGADMPTRIKWEREAKHFQS